MAYISIYKVDTFDDVSVYYQGGKMIRVNKIVYLRPRNSSSDPGSEGGGGGGSGIILTNDPGGGGSS